MRTILPMIGGGLIVAGPCAMIIGHLSGMPWLMLVGFLTTAAAVAMCHECWQERSVD